jgi:ferredoxin-NADP reductase
MATPSFLVTCTEKTLIATDVYQLHFTKPEAFSYRAGQFVLFDTPLVHDANDVQPRAYSLASVPDEDDLLFVIKLKDGGRFSEFLEQKIDVGSAMTMKGPFGFFTPKHNDHTKLFIGTGTGIAPFRAHLLSLLKAGDTSPLCVYFGVRNEEDLFWTEEMLSLSNQYSNLSMHCCLSGENADQEYLHGRVQEFFPESVSDPLNTDVYICGNPAMVKEVKTLCIDVLGIPKVQVHGEGYV